MTTAELLSTAKDLLSTWTTESKTIEPNRLDVAIAPEHLLDAVTAMTESHWGYLITITGLDPGPATGQLEVLYHFCSGAAVTTLRVRIPRDQPNIASIKDIIPPALFFERELSEMFGIAVGDLKDGDHLFLPENWPAGVYPLRKDFQASKATEQTSD